MRPTAQAATGGTSNDALSRKASGTRPGRRPVTEVLGDRLLGVDTEARLELFRANSLTWRSSLGGAALMSLLVAWGFGLFAPIYPLLVWVALCWLVCGAMAPLLMALERWPMTAPLPARWTLAIMLSSVVMGVLWGSLPWWLPGGNRPLQLLAALGSAMVLLGAASASNAVGTLRAVLLPAVPLVPGAMVWHAHNPLAGLVAVVLVLIILRHGESVQRNTVQAIVQRLEIERLSRTLLAQQAVIESSRRIQAVLDERQRVMRDMHDGIGASLVSALKMMEQGRMSVAEGAEVLRECLDELRLVIDSLEPVEHDLVTMLASLRSRLGGRLQSAGIAIDWPMDAVDPITWLCAAETLQVLRIVQESLANVLKHAHASRVRIALRTEALAGPDLVLLLTVEDDGAGFDPSADGATGRGLSHMRQRASLIGAHLRVDARVGGGTRVLLRIPRSHRPSAAVLAEFSTR